MSAPNGHERQLGKITRAVLEREDHGILTLWLHFGGSGQGFGGVALDVWDEKLGRRVGTAMGLDLVSRLLDLFKVDRLEQIAGRAAYALRKGGWNSPIEGIALPEFDGGATLLLDEWRADWAGEIAALAKRGAR